MNKKKLRKKDTINRTVSKMCYKRYLPEGSTVAPTTWLNELIDVAVRVIKYEYENDVY